MFDCISTDLSCRHDDIIPKQQVLAKSQFVFGQQRHTKRIFMSRTGRGIDQGGTGTSSGRAVSDV